MWFADLKPISPFFASFDLNSLVSPSGLPLNPWGETLKLPLQLSLRLVASLYCSCIWQLAQLQVGSCWIQSASLDSIAVLPVLWGWQRIAIHAFESGSSGTSEWENLGRVESMPLTVSHSQKHRISNLRIWGVLFVLQFVEVVLAAVSNCGLSIQYAAPHLHRVTWLADSEGTL